MKALVSGLFIGLASAAIAQDNGPRGVDAQSVPACFDQAKRGQTAPDCLGRAAQGCQIPGCKDTSGIVACTDAETAVRNGMLVEQYAYLTRSYRIRGAQLQNAERDTQLAWNAYGDAACALDYERWGDGSVRVIVAAHCKMTETAERALESRDKKEF